MRMFFDAIRALIYSTGFVFLWAYAALWVRRYDASLGISLPSWMLIPGVVSMALGAPIALACIITFVVRGRGTPAPFDAPRELVAAGPYRWVRNPMYLGAGMIVVGYGFYVRSVSVLLLGRCNVDCRSSVRIFLRRADTPREIQRFVRKLLP